MLNKERLSTYFYIALAISFLFAFINDAYSGSVRSARVSSKSYRVSGSNSHKTKSPRVKPIKSDKKSSFGTGLVLGALAGSYFSSTHQIEHGFATDSSDIKEMQPYNYSHISLLEKKLCDELLYNEFLLERTGKLQQDEIIHFRNKQIIRDLTDKVKNKILSGLKLKLIIINERIFERKKVGSYFSPPLLVGQKMPKYSVRKVITYKIKLAKSSLFSIKDFDVLSVTSEGNALFHFDNKFRYEEKWGMNKIDIILKPKSYEKFNFKLSTSYFIGY